MNESSYKILHTTCHREWGGLEKRIFNEVIWMRDHGHQAAVVLPEDTPLFKKLKAERFRVYPMAFKRLGTWKNYHRLVEICKTEMPDILNTHGNADTKIALPAAKKAKVPCRILSRHIGTRVRNTWYNRKLYKKLSHYIFTTSEYTRQHLQKVFKIPGIEIFSIPSGVKQPEEMPTKETARQRIALELGVPQDTRFIGFASRISKEKGVITLIKAFGKIAQTIKHNLIIIGDADPTYLKFLKKETKKLRLENRIHFLGFKEDVWAFYRIFECTILPSRMEGVPQTLLEAMFSECPVIGTKTGGILDIIEHEHTGLLCDVDNVDQLADQICFTLSNEDKTKDRVIAARNFVRQNHSLDVMGRNLIRIYSLHQVKLRREGMVQDSEIPEPWDF